MREIFENFLVSFTDGMNVLLTNEITQQELYGAIELMGNGKSPGHDGIPMEYFKQLWPALGNDFYLMIQRSITHGGFHDCVTKGVQSLIPKEGG